MGCARKNVENEEKRRAERAGKFFFWGVPEIRGFWPEADIHFFPPFHLLPRGKKRVHFDRYLLTDQKELRLPNPQRGKGYAPSAEVASSQAALRCGNHAHAPGRLQDMIAGGAL